MSQLDNIVSSDLEDLILVNENDESIGTMPKRACHEEDGQLHRKLKWARMESGEPRVLPDIQDNLTESAEIVISQQ